MRTQSRVNWVANIKKKIKHGKFQSKPRQVSQNVSYARKWKYLYSLKDARIEQVKGRNHKHINWKGMRTKRKQNCRHYFARKRGLFESKFYISRPVFPWAVEFWQIIDEHFYVGHFLRCSRSYFIGLINRIWAWNEHCLRIDALENQNIFRKNKHKIETNC